ncbi:MAG: zinc-ribbon and DUF3426 domain-containing protein [Betaproteobacteria bacterium]
MSIATQCPSCGTTFRVTPPQLQAQHGMVRCGRCAQVFDGFKTLATLPDAPPANAEPPADARASAPVAPAPAAPAEPISEIAAPPAFVRTVTVIDKPPVRVEPAPIEEPAPVAEPQQYIEPSFEMRPPRRRNGGWAVGVVVMLFALAAQAAYFYRSDIAASLPEARPQLNKLCELLQCTVALPQRPRQISIEASDMQAPDPANPGVIALTATLRNHATTALGYPALDVVLTNTKEHTVARRIFVPADYLAAGKDPRTGIAPNAEVTIRLDLDTGDLGAAGFRLDLIGAPAR